MEKKSQIAWHLYKLNKHTKIQSCEPEITFKKTKKKVTESSKLQSTVK